ncbi:DUF692 family protein [Clostridium felsineum]|uniref:multinuclear nonheme iron-dependent oxidase n=1 Tax=Clostridium felsineum TaxID=36839 RepID=UPI00214DACA7|nr:DUF692 family multinuclear iron-containing protein [Clostridium felsineum]MCR3760940.1 DUF692 family protein [Clostridium felsineum]
MYIGCNWSNSLKFLIEKNEVKIDYIKSGVYGDFMGQFSNIRSITPILLHGLGYFECAGMKNIDIIDFHFAKNLIKKCGSPHYAIHLAIKNSDIYVGMTDEDIYKRMSKNITMFKKNISVPILLENIPDTPKEHQISIDHYPYIMPDKISRLIIDNNVSFLLDLTHAKITAQYHGFNVYDYIKELPLERVVEIHVNGSGYDENGFPKDTHEAMKNEDYILLEWVLNYTKPKIVTLEYNGIKTEQEDRVRHYLKKQINEIEKICGKKQRGNI